MILTCPECATSYFVDELIIPPSGRTVRCSDCGARWRAHPEPVEPPVEAVPQRVIEVPPPAARQGEIHVAPPPVAPVAEAAGRRRPRRPPVGRIVAIGAVVGLAVLVGAAVVFRQKVAAAAPATGPLFAAVGLHVDTAGLVVEQVKSRAVLEAGRPALSVTGAVRNTRRETAQVPPLRIDLLDRSGKLLDSLVAKPANGALPPGARRFFAVSLPNPPAGLNELRVGFEASAKPGAAAQAAAHTAATAHEAAPPEEARPLPPGSPDALRPHE